MPTLAAVRWVALVAGLVGIFLSSVVVSDPAGVFWFAILAAVAAIQLFAANDWRIGPRLNAEEEMFHRGVVPSLNSGEVRRLLTIGTWREVVPGTHLTVTGERIVELCFIVRGQVDVMVDGKKVTECGPGQLVGEGGLSTGDAATATSVCATPVRYLGFEANRLYRLLDGHVALADAMELAIERSLGDKLHRANVAAAHPPKTVPG
jgi:CRP-like cAMP-binding protein